MAKTKETIALEKAIIKETSKKGVFNCLEVTIGFGGKQRVDFMSMDTKDTFRCYEIKISKSDFHSKYGHNFVGHYNYYVMPKELYKEIKDEIPKEIGVYIGGFYTIKSGELRAYVQLEKRPKRKELEVSLDIIKSSMIRSLYREVEKGRKSDSVNKLNNYKYKINKLTKEKNEYKNKLITIENYLHIKLGREEFKRLKDKLYND